MSRTKRHVPNWVKGMTGTSNDEALNRRFKRRAEIGADGMFPKPTHTSFKDEGYNGYDEAWGQQAKKFFKKRHSKHQRRVGIE